MVVELLPYQFSLRWSREFLSCYFELLNINFRVIFISNLDYIIHWISSLLNYYLLVRSLITYVRSRVKLGKLC